MKCKLFLLILFLFFLFPVLSYSQPYPPYDYPHPLVRQKDYSFLVGLGSLLVIKPEKDALFHFTTEYGYYFAGPLWFNLGGGFGVNGSLMKWDTFFGFLGKIKIPRSPLCPVVKINFILMGFHPFEKGEFNYVMGGVFETGIQYVFKNQRAIGLYFDLQIGKQLMKPKETYTGIVFYTGFEF